MTARPVFMPGKTADTPFEEVSVAFKWHGGFALSQKLRNIDGLHAGFLARFPGRRMLEISTKSDQPIGQALSAFNLKLDLPVTGIVALESAYQQQGVSTADLYGRDAKGRYAAKKDPRLQIHGDLIGSHQAGMPPQALPASMTGCNAGCRCGSSANWRHSMPLRTAFNLKKSHNRQARTARSAHFSLRHMVMTGSRRHTITACPGGIR